MSPYTHPANLAANRKGQITEDQRQFARLHNSYLNYITFGMIFVAAIGVGAIFTVRDSADFPQTVLVMTVIGGVIGIAIGVPLTQAFVAQRRLERDLTTGNVEQSQGRIYWRANTYVAEADGRRLRTQHGLTLEPGDYMLYYLPHSRWLVGAEKLAGETDTNSGFQRTLARLLHCDLSALEQNRAGRLSDSQRWWLTLFAGGFLGLAFVLFVVALLIGFNVLTHLGQANPFGGLILFVLPSGIGVLLTLQGLPLLRDLLANTVRIAEGGGKRSTTGGARNMTVYFHVGQERFVVPPAVYNGIVEGVRYRLFYTPKARRIVNVEVVK
jgi:hypothetical protein